MLYYVISSGLALILLIWFINSRGPSLPKLVSESVRDEDISPLMVAVAGLPIKRRPFFFQEAIEMLWNSWHRVLATELIKEFVTMHPDDKIGQYWVQQAMDIEPETAKGILDDNFITSYYRQEIAATCGPAG